MKNIGAVAIVASAGGIPALVEFVRQLPATFPLPILVTQHLPRSASNLDWILARSSALEFGWAREGERPRAGCVHLAPPDRSMSVGRYGFELSPLAAPSSSWLACGDSLLQSLVAQYGSRSIGIVFSGMLAAGVRGIRAINAAGGFTFAQDRASCGHFEMPAAAIDFGKVQMVLPPGRIAAALSIIGEQWQTPPSSPGGAAARAA